MAFVIWTIFSKSTVAEIKHCFCGIWTCAFKKRCNLNDELNDIQKPPPPPPITEQIKSAPPPQVFYNSSFLEQLICSNCLQILSPPIYVCMNGKHSICKICRSKICICPKCWREFPESYTRNFVLEAFILASNHECPYKIFGCQICPLGKLMNEHIKNCKYRLLRLKACPMFGLDDCCKNILEINEVKEHFIKLHGGKIHSIISNFFVRSVKTTNFGHFYFYTGPLFFRPDLIEFDGNTFLIQMYGVTPQNFYLFILCFDGKTNVKKKYGVNIIIQSKKRRYYSIRWKYEIPQTSDVGNLFTENSDVPIDTLDWPQYDLSDFEHLISWNKTRQSYMITMVYEFFEIP